MIMRNLAIVPGLLLLCMLPLAAGSQNPGAELAMQQSGDQLLLPIRQNQGSAQDTVTTGSQATSATMTVADIAHLLQEKQMLPTPPNANDNITTSTGSITTNTLTIMTTPTLAILPLPPPGAIRGGKVWLNEATAEDLIAVLQIDYQRARNVIKYREIFGEFKTVDELAEVSGFHDAMVKLFRDKIGIAPANAGKVERKKQEPAGQDAAPVTSVFEDQKIGNARTHIHPPELP